MKLTKSWYVRYGNDQDYEEHIILCNEEEKVRNFAYNQAKSLYNYNDSEDNELQFFFEVEPYSPYDTHHVNIFRDVNFEVIVLDD